ncbi:hypothetical protein [Geothermobacter hydrogeniphilus]|uniref:Uncharacterized protein n=1 Tax=Geothermobacter hydrogeniphilus TaxID=1969733 RepID=A0A1X0Y5G8_9BACT|nr:hypothetical protein [Geothermobacter hydrogeniphilus]ORJ60312.1 hypothetical protein B5V00_08660 [Geothermobacter hydrogeniphilus]
MDDASIYISLDLGEGKSPRAIAGLGKALLNGFEQIVENLPIAAESMVSPGADVLEAKSGVTKLIILMNEFRAIPVDPRKRIFDSAAASEFVIKMLNCYVKHLHVSLKLMEIDPEDFDPLLDEVGEKLLDAIEQFFLNIGKYINQVPIKISTKENIFQIPGPADPFWKKIMISKPRMDLAALEELADVMEVSLRKVDATNKNCWTGTVSEDKIWKLKFSEKALDTQLAAISQTTLEVSGAFWQDEFWIFKILDIQYPEGIDVDLSEAAQLVLELEQ